VTLRVVVVDDEPLPRQRVRDLVAQHPALELVGEAADGTQALDVIVDRRPDLVFLDIQMPELDGLQVAAALGDDAPPFIVFVTAYDEYAIRAFEVDALDYLLKPVTAERFAMAVARVLGRIGTDANRATRFVARRGGRHYFVRVAEIDWIEAVGNYVRLHTGGTSHLIRETMKGMEERLDPTAFVRIHRSAIVAIDRIVGIEAREQGEYVVTLPGRVRVTSSRSYGDRIRALVRR
jgi:two-component system LytT family response regulator